MIYEIRVYEAADGKADAMKRRFKSEVMPRLPVHGIELLGVFEAPTDADRLTYLTRFQSEGDRRLGHRLVLIQIGALLKPLARSTGRS